MAAYQVTCQGPGCGVGFTAKRPHAKYHNEACRKRAQRPGSMPRKPPPSKPARRAKPAAPYLEAATRAELGKIARTDSAAGRVALMLAKRLDNSAGEGLAAMAAASREWASAMERATREGPADDPVTARADEVARRRDRHVAG